jgi:hypothetical protein
MEDEDLTVSPRIRSEAGLLLDQLLALGWEICALHCSPGVMGSWFVNVRRNEIKLRLIKDRGQYSVNGPVEEL